MYIDQLTIKNFRCFAQAKMDFHWQGFSGREKKLRLPNVNLLIGNNGTGKTTIFQALTIASLGSYLKDNISGFRTPRVIRYNEESAEATAGLILYPMDKNVTGGEDAITGGHSATGVLKRNGNRATGVIKRKGSEESLDARGNDLWVHHLFEKDHPGSFIAAYGAGRRTERPEAYNERLRGTRYQRIATLFETHVGLIPLSLAYAQCQERERWDEVVEIINQLLQPSVRLTQKTEDGEPLFDYDGIPLPVSELSDGYRLFVGWLIDCLMHLARVLPKDLRLTAAAGIVIVDEVDLFLSPSWQRTVLESLSNTFPYIQWFCSTHSPLVAGSLENDNIYILEKSGPYTSRIRRPTDKFEGMSVETVLIELFNVQQPRSTELQRQLGDLAKRAIDGDMEASLEYLRRLNQGTAKR